MDRIANILLVEDDSNLGSILKEYLELKSFGVNLCEDGAKGYSAFKASSAYDIIILDIMMPEMDGFTLAKEIRALDKVTPIIFLSAKTMKEDKIKGFRTGADDYITKPFSMEELLLRIQAVLRRVQQSPVKKSKYEFGDFTFEYDMQLLKIDKTDKKLTTKEAELLRLLCQNVNQTITRENALKEIWGTDDYFKGRSMDVFITRLRKYLKLDPSIELMNVHGMGFKLIVKGP